MTDKTNSSIDNARAKLAAAVEMYTPYNAGRPSAIAALTAVLVEFEAAVREDERALLGANIDPTFPTLDVLERNDLPPTLPANPLAHPEVGTPSAEALEAQSGKAAEVNAAAGEAAALVTTPGPDGEVAVITPPAAAVDPATKKAKTASKK